MRYTEKRMSDAFASDILFIRKDIEKQLSKYYEKSMKKIIGQFEQTHKKVFLSIEEGKEPTPADLYKLDSYWKLQGQMRMELEKLGNWQAVLMSR